MASVEKTVLIGHSAEKMYALVDHCEDYPNFLPWCSRAEVLQRDAGKTAATLHIDYHGVKSHFTTENSKTFPSQMLIRLLDGPFRKLEGAWHFRALNATACKIEFVLHYEFSSKLLEKIIGPVFSRITNTFVDAFIKRADQVYGVPNVWVAQ